MNELNKDQIRLITNWLNRNSDAMKRELKGSNPAEYAYEMGKAAGANFILDILGYDSVYDQDLDHISLRKREAEDE